MKQQQEMSNSVLATTRNNRVERERESRWQGLPVYEMPRVLTYTDDQILAELGPAQTNIY